MKHIYIEILLPTRNKYIPRPSCRITSW